jgi:ectoine hydroxylase-related dioxygenase (phytanoyl-CoA dioxygenase family)
MWANYLVKLPGADPVPLHVDWTFLDEDRFSSVTVWCPLLDTDESNGALGLVTGSQDRIDFVRIVNVPCYDRCEEAVSDLADRPVVPMRAGQAIIMDNRAVHFSTPNSTDERRVVAACVAGPVEADLHHYWLDPDDDVVRFDLDRRFYLTYQVGRPPAEAEGVRGREVVGSGGG